MKIRSMGAELLHADGRTGMMYLIVAFRNFANSNKTRRCIKSFRSNISMKKSRMIKWAKYVARMVFVTNR